MAMGDESYKLPMRSWLSNLVDKGEIEGLEWLDSGKRYVKIPWTKVHLPGWENCQKVVQAWADHQHREEKKGVKSDFTTLKANFRNAIHKSEDFEENKEMSELQNQTGNFKVYQILSRSEVEAKKKERKLQKEETRKRKNHQKLSSGGKLVCGKQNFDDGSFKVAGKEDLGMPSISHDGILHMLDSSQTACPVDPSQLPGFALPSQNFIPNIHEQPCGQSNYYDSSAVSPEGNTPCRYSTTCTSDDSPPDVVAHSMFQTGIEATQCTEDHVMDFVTADLFPPSLPCTPPLGLLELLELFGVPDDNLSICELSITYNSEQVYSSELRDTELGYRLFYGDDSNLEKLFAMHQRSEEYKMNYKYKPIHLPNPKSQFPKLQKILDKTDLGITIRYDIETHSFYLKRLCQSQVFYTDPHKPVCGQQPIKIERDEEICIFSYETFLHALYNFVQLSDNDSSLVVSPIVYISIGSKSNLERDQIPRGIKAILVPKALKQLINYDEHTGEPSLHLSKSIPLEQIMRQMKL